MNINEAKKHIRNAVIAYRAKDRSGNYMISQEKQRPIFLIGPPGIGKTAIMKQIADEQGVAFVSYSMTHHTRQSAIGLPSIVTKKFDGIEYKISEYTMSEIIASVYDQMTVTGLREGILFLDEINCVSETLAPAMLQFLQYKVFGGHRIPEGWIVVTAGNPPEYNESVREFDAAIKDRLRIISAEADFDTWKEYAIENNVHPAIISFLETDNNKEESFYSIKSTENVMSIITARSWCDLSDIIKTYEFVSKEQEKLEIDYELIKQYIQDNDAAQSFYIHYKKYLIVDDELLNAFMANRLSGKQTEKIRSFTVESRLVLVDLLVRRIKQVCKEYIFDLNILRKINSFITSLDKNDQTLDSLKDILFKEKYKLNKRKLLNQSNQDSAVAFTAISQLEEYCSISKEQDCADLSVVKKLCKEKLSRVEQEKDNHGIMIDNTLSCLEENLPDHIDQLVRMIKADKNCLNYLRYYDSKLLKKYLGNITVDSAKQQIDDILSKLFR